MIELRYDSRGHFYATSAAMMVEHATLKRAAGSSVPKPGFRYLCAWFYPDGVQVGQSDCLDWSGKNYAADHDRLFERYGHKVYRRRTKGWTQYWLFLLYNDKSFLGLGLHEGDWEMVQVHDDGRCVFGQHNYGTRADWDGVVYVSAGSHALYPKPGEHEAPVTPDLADGEGSHVEPDIVPFGDWKLWPGRWGSTRPRNKAESWSPESPSRQRRWRDPEWFWRTAR